MNKIAKLFLTIFITSLNFLIFFKFIPERKPGLAVVDCGPYGGPCVETEDPICFLPGTKVMTIVNRRQSTVNSQNLLNAKPEERKTASEEAEGSETKKSQETWDLDLVHLTNPLKDWIDNLESNLSEDLEDVKGQKIWGVDSSGIAPDRLGLSIQSSVLAEPTPESSYNEAQLAVNSPDPGSWNSSIQDRNSDDDWQIEEKNIEDIEVGEWVVGMSDFVSESFSPEPGSGNLSSQARNSGLVPVQVTKVFWHEGEEAAKAYLVVTMEDGKELKVTPEHLVYLFPPDPGSGNLSIQDRNAGGGQWMPIGEAEAGDYLWSLNFPDPGSSNFSIQDRNGGEWQKITSIQEIHQTTPVYNLETTPTHNFFANGFLVHNEKAPAEGEGGSGTSPDCPCPPCCATARSCGFLTFWDLNNDGLWNSGEGWDDITAVHSKDCYAGLGPRVLDDGTYSCYDCNGDGTDECYNYWDENENCTQESFELPVAPPTSCCTTTNVYPYLIAPTTYNTDCEQGFDNNYYGTSAICESLRPYIVGFRQRHTSFSTWWLDETFGPNLYQDWGYSLVSFPTKDGIDAWSKAWSDSYLHNNVKNEDEWVCSYGSNSYGSYSLGPPDLDGGYGGTAIAVTSEDGHIRNGNTMIIYRAVVKARTAGNSITIKGHIVSSTTGPSGETKQRVAFNQGTNCYEGTGTDWRPLGSSPPTDNDPSEYAGLKQEGVRPLIGRTPGDPYGTSTWSNQCLNKSSGVTVSNWVGQHDEKLTTVSFPTAGYYTVAYLGWNGCHGTASCCGKVDDPMSFNFVFGAYPGSKTYFPINRRYTKASSGNLYVVTYLDSNENGKYDWSEATNPESAINAGTVTLEKKPGESGTVPNKNPFSDGVYFYTIMEEGSARKYRVKFDPTASYTPKNWNYPNSGSTGQAFTKCGNSYCTDEYPIVIPESFFGQMAIYLGVTQPPAPPTTINFYIFNDATNEDGKKGSDTDEPYIDLLPAGSFDVSWSRGTSKAGPFDSQGSFSGSCAGGTCSKETDVDGHYKMQDIETGYYYRFRVRPK